MEIKSLSKPLKVKHIQKQNNKSDLYFSSDDRLRLGIIGPSNSGKTTILLSLITELEGIKFENIHLISKTLNQEKYNYLENLMKLVPEITFTTSSEMPEEFKPNTLVIFDDFINKNLNYFFTFSRHNKLDVIILSQSYLFLNKHSIRENLNYLILFKIDIKNLRHVYDEHISDLSFDYFKELCNTAWQKRKGFIAIDLVRNKYFLNFTHEFIK